MWPAFEKAQVRYEELEGLLGDPEVIGDRARYTRLAKEHGALARQVKPYRDYVKTVADIAQAEGMLAGADAEMQGLIREELGELRPKADALRSRLEDLLLAE